jgi:hypothetical protein
VFRRLSRDDSSPPWHAHFAALAPGQQDALAPLALTALLRRAKGRGDLGMLRNGLELAVAHGLTARPVAAQAAALLRRSQALNALG